jgi:hypothetical protein
MAEVTDREVTPSESTPFNSVRPRKGAAGKALLVYLGTGSIGVALVAYLLFHSMGC